ncbi:MAG: DNA repair protein RecO [Planctomycetota bacterium]
MNSTLFPHPTLATPLHVLNYRESSQILTLLTREYGKISVLARGIKPLKRKTTLQPMELLSFYEIRLRPGKELHYLAENQMTAFFSPFRHDLARLYGGYYLLELVRTLLQEGEPATDLFDLFFKGCEKLAVSAQIKPVLLGFEFQLLKLLGFFPELQHCLLCGNNFGDWLLFSSAEGGGLCLACAREQKKMFPNQTFLKLRRKSLDAFLQIEQNILPLEADVLQEIRKFLQHYWSYLLEQELKLFSYISKMKTP